MPQPRRNGIARRGRETTGSLHPSLGRSLKHKRARNIYRTDADGRLRLHFDGPQRVYYLQLVSPLSELVIGAHALPTTRWLGSEDGMPRYANAISPTDPQSWRAARFDPAIFRGRQPWAATIGVGAFLKTAGRDFVVAETVSAEGEIVPAVGLLIQDSEDFWEALIPDDPRPGRTDSQDQEVRAVEQESVRVRGRSRWHRHPPGALPRPRRIHRGNRVSRASSDTSQFRAQAPSPEEPHQVKKSHPPAPANRMGLGRRENSDECEGRGLRGLRRHRSRSKRTQVPTGALTCPNPKRWQDWQQTGRVGDDHGRASHALRRRRKRVSAYEL